MRDRIMKDYLRKIGFTAAVFTALICLVFSPGGTSAAEKSPREKLPTGELADRIQAVYDGAVDLKAAFTQESTIKALKKTEKESGTVYFKKPRRMLWDYSSPQRKKLIINPKTAWLYVPEDKLVYMQDADALISSRLTIRFLTGIGKLKDDFQVRYASDPYDREGNYLLELVPKTKDVAAGFDKLSVTVDRNTYLITRCVFRDMYGNVTRISFRNFKLNNGLSDSLFNFTPPAGVTVQKI